ncbi:hypothetical protein Tco_0110967 [Tanacetum coccineum]
MMFQSKSFQSHEHHLHLYNALMNSMAIDKLVARGEISCTPTLKKQSHDDHDNLENLDGEKRKRIQEQEAPTKEIGGEFAHWFKKKDSTKDDAPEQR